MSSKLGTVLAFLALVVATGALGYATWMSLKLQDSLSVLAETQERNLKEMMISLAHTEGQLGRVKEAMNAFDLQKWLAAVQGPLVDRLEEKMSAAQRQVVREEVTKSAQQITREQTDHWQVFSKSMAGANAEIAKQAGATDQLGKALTKLIRDNEALAKKHQEGIQAQFMLVLQRSQGIEDRLSQADGPTAQVEADLAGIKAENQSLRELLEQRSAADREFREQVQESLTRFAEAMAKQEATAQEQIDQARLRWQGLFTTLRENHEAELESDRKMMSQFEEKRALLPEKVNNVEAEGARSVDKGREGADGRLENLRKFCVRRPESVLCRDIDTR